MIIFHRTPDHEGGMARLTERDPDEAAEAGLIPACPDFPGKTRRAPYCSKDSK